MAGDTSYSKVSLLLPCTGANNSTAIIDHSNDPKIITVLGDAKIVTTTTDPFGNSNGVLNLDGTGDYLNLGTNKVFTPTTGKFTIEGFIRPANVTGWKSIFSNTWTNAFNNNFALALNGAVLAFLFRTSGSADRYIQGGTVSANVWLHVAAVRDGANLYLFAGGTQVAISTAVASDTFGLASDCNIGRGSSSITDYFNGKLAYLRVTLDVARYTSNFTPPAAPYLEYQSQISGTIVESLAANTFIARARDIDTGALVGTKAFTGTSSFTVDITTAAQACEVTVSADYKIWKASTVYTLDDKVFPVDPVAKPYYYKRIAAGTSGSTEPTWPTTAGGQCDDGAVTNAWELVERLIQPVTHGPLIPS